ncbi:hypothetical protein QQY79_10325 [Flavobacterium tructae]|uniref:hypothetical protein n=1 Tax=Flavobacterium tructae TaxID=1114873 RepID=UPI002551CEC9|nr:hypothetical protein [Flavobacterium tructae]MDL2142915.1 hypothetical protein [Flavobacterium tructae]
MNLENLNLVELSAQEVEEIEGGTTPYTGGTMWAGREVFKFAKGFINGFLDNL